MTEAGSPSEALRVVDTLEPDVILLDVEISGSDGFALCSVCGAGTSDCQTDGCGIAPEDARNADVLGIRADVLYDLAQDIEAQARSHADRAVLLRARSEDLQDRADGAA